MRGIGWVVLAVVASCGGDNKAQGEVGGHCYPNGTCNLTLDCVGGICMAAMDGRLADAVQEDAGSDAPSDVAIDATIDALTCDNQFEPNETIPTAHPIPFGAGQLLATFTTTPAGSSYAPNNIVAVWIEQAGSIVKTAGRWAALRQNNLVAWVAKAGSTDTDAISGATRADHSAPLTVAWDLRNRFNSIIADGTYTLRMELADGNSTATGQNNQGSFTFTKSNQSQVQTALTNGGFTNVSINFSPRENTKTLSNVSICPLGDRDHYMIDVPEANSNVEVIVTYGGSGAQVTASILNSSGNAISNATSNGTNSIRAYVANLPVGTYYTVVGATNGVNDYEITVTRTPP